MMTPSAYSKQKTMAAKCRDIKQQVELEQFKYHNTVARMTVDLRTFSTPSTTINDEKLREHISSLKKTKKQMNKLVASELYRKCL